MLSILDEVLHYVKFYDNLLVILCIDIVSRPKSFPETHLFKPNLSSTFAVL